MDLYNNCMVVYIFGHEGAREKIDRPGFSIDGRLKD